MKKEFIPYNLALELKELGFDEECFNVYDKLKYLQNQEEMEMLSLEFIKAPLWQQAFDWFRGKHGFDLFFMPMSIVGITMYYDIEIRHQKYVWDAPPKVTGKTYEEARLECLKKLIEIVKQK